MNSNILTPEPNTSQRRNNGIVPFVDSRIRERLLVGTLAVTFFLSAPMEPMHSGLLLIVRMGLCLVITVAILWKQILKIPLRNFLTPALLVLLLMGISLTQSLSRFALENLFAYFFVFLIAILTSVSLRVDKLALGIAIGGALVAIYSALFAVVIPGSSWMSGRLAGPFTGWNNFAMMLVFALPAVLCFRAENKFLRFFKIFTLIILGAEIFLAQSTSSRIVFSALIAVYVAFITFKTNKKLGWLVCLFYSISLTIIALNWQAFLGFLNKSNELNGRVPIWQATLDFMRGHELSGYGWEPQFGYTNPVGVHILEKTGYFQMHTHNDFLYWFSTIGIVGAILVYLTLFWLIIRATLVKRRKGEFIHPWTWMGALGLILGGVTEVSVVLASGWIVFTLISSQVKIEPKMLQKKY